MAQVTLDALFFTVLRFRYRALWAGVVAHGTVDTVGHRSCGRVLTMRPQVDQA